MPAPLLSLRNMTKAYGQTKANSAIDLDVAAGSIHAILGENGAGKSTLMKLIYGVERPDEGEVLWNGSHVHLTSPAEARRLGIGMVFQHFSLFETLTVVENISLIVPGSKADLAARIRALGQDFGLVVDPFAHVHALSVGERQRVEIIRCLLTEPRLLILDEPTSVLPPQAVGLLFDTLRRLRDGGVSILSSFEPGGADDWSWAWKLLFTVITLSSGFKGGEVTPLFFIGAALGNVLGSRMGMPVELFAGLGLIAVFAGAAKTPLSCTILGMEIFGLHNTMWFALACLIAYLVSGKEGIYRYQK
ncbi:MAG: hypothetical protein RI979_491 [Pseudomonadota bacterium]